MYHSLHDTLSFPRHIRLGVICARGLHRPRRLLDHADREVVPLSLRVPILRIGGLVPRPGARLEQLLAPGRPCDRAHMLKFLDLGQGKLLATGQNVRDHRVAALAPKFPLRPVALDLRALVLRGPKESWQAILRRLFRVKEKRVLL